MSPGTLKKWVILPLLVAAGGWFGWTMLLGRADVTRPATWQVMAIPGPMSKSHAFLANNCAACHTPNKGVEAQSCIVCHANNESLLQRQPTSFHADVQSCVECHVEHQGTDRRPTQMDHAALANLGLRHLSRSDPAGEKARHQPWIGKDSPHAPFPSGSSPMKAHEAALNCATCHTNEDRHRGFFGRNCVQCHTTTDWTIPEFRHPSPASTSCVQCHQAPPSHYMEHFKMVSMKMARQENAQVNDCFKCHHTTSWNDIKGAGWYKHH